MSKKVLISTGGTGGHVYPAMALAKQLKKEVTDVQVLFIGGGLSANRYFDRKEFSFTNISCGTISLKRPLKSLLSVVKILRGIWQSRKIIHQFKPDIVVGFGSYYTLPALIAAKMARVPFVLHESNSIPGKVIRLLSPYAVMTGVQFPDAALLLKGCVEEVSMPLREGYHRGSCSQKEAKKYFQLDTNRLTVLIFGGSLGAQAINNVVPEALRNVSGIQIVHIAGNVDAVKQLQQTYSSMGISFCVKSYENRMDMAWQAADVVISRSGAGTIAEALEFEVPAILIPYPAATDNHQEKNADFMVKRVGGGVKLLEKELNPEALARLLQGLMSDNARQTIRRKLSDYKKEYRQNDLCSLVKKII